MPEPTRDHLVPLGTTGWGVWPWGLLRAAGFPVEGLAKFGAPAVAAAADALLESGEPGGSGADGGRAEFDARFAEWAQRIGKVVVELAEDPLFREAIVWQNPTAAHTMLAPVVAAGPDAPRNASRRGKENGIARYWSRYCAKNDSIGFFGPVCWVRVDGDLAGITATPGAGLVRERSARFERWALTTYGDKLAQDPKVRAWLPAKLLPTLALDADGRHLHHPTRGTLALSRAEAAIVTRCDGHIPAIDVIRAAVADPDSTLRRVEDGFLMLDALVEREIMQWGIDLPISLRCEDVMRRHLENIGDPEIQRRAWEGYEALDAGRAEIAAAAGDPDALLAALGRLDETFVEVTGSQPRQSHGQTYAGRTLCYEDTTRDLDAVIGTVVLDALAPPMHLLLTAARWLSAAVGEAYMSEIHVIYEDLAAESGTRDVSLGEVWFLAQGLFFGTTDRPVDAVSAEFIRRWASLLRLDSDAREQTFTSAELAEDVARTFPAERPGWSAARMNCPDIHILAPDIEAITRGEFDLALGELHAAWNTLDSEFFVVAHPDPAELLEYLRRDVPPGRLEPLYPTDWPRLTSRTCSGLNDPADRQLGFVVAPGSEPAELLPTAAVTVSDVDGELVATAPDGQRWPIVEVFANLLATHTVDAFKLLGAHQHSPRVTIDRLVVNRETWRFPPEELGFVTVKDERERYLATRRWRLKWGLPDQVFVKLDTEIKPFYVDLTSPVYINFLCTSVRGAIKADPNVTIVVTEMMPTTDQAWVPGPDGERYASELRILAVDPTTATWRPDGWPR